MKFKWGIIIICLLICLLNVVGVSASDVNDIVVAIDEQNDDLIEIENQYDVITIDNPKESNADFVNSIDYSQKNFTNYDNDEISSSEDINILGSLTYKQYSVYVPNSILNYQKGGTIDCHINYNVGSISGTGVEFYINVYDLDNYLVYHSSKVTVPAFVKYASCEISKHKITPGEYTIEVINSQDGHNMATSRITVINSTGNNYDCFRGDIASVSSGGTLYLDKDYIFEDNLYSKFNLLKEITIDGMGHIIDANNSKGIFEIASDNVIIKNIIFKNIYSTNSDGSTITWNGKYGKLINCTFINNHAVRGGAVEWIGFGSEMNGCTFINNSANNGGAVYLGHTVAMSNCTFINNSANNGGAIMSLSEINYNKIINFIFINNTASNGGAIYFTDIVNGGLIVSNSTFINNNATNSGGAIYAYRIEITQCNFINNYAKYGGAISLNNYKYNRIENCKFNNDSAGTGGAVYTESAACNIINSNFTSCTAAYCGAIYKVNSLDCVFRNCSASLGVNVAYNSSLENCAILKCGEEDEAIFNCEAINCRYIETPFISVAPVTVRYGQDVILIVNLFSDVSGYVRFTLNGVTEKAKITKGKATYTFSGLNYGLYNVNVSYGGNYKYDPDVISTTIKVNKNVPITSVVSDDISYGENATIIVNLAQNVVGNVQITVDNITQKVKVINNVASATFIGLKRGSYDVTVSYNGNINFVAQTKTTGFKVIKGTPIISVDVPDVGYGEDAIITVNLGSDVPGNVRVTINNVTEKAKITNGKATYIVSGLKRGYYEVIVNYAGNVNYKAQNFTTTLNIVKGTPINSVSVKSIKIGDTAFVNVKFANNVNGFVKITVNGITQRVQIVYGHASCNVSNLKAGAYDVSVTYAGTANFNAQTATSSFNVSKLSPGITIRKSTVDGSPVITVKMAQDAPGNVRIIVNGSTYKLPIVTGTATISLPNLKSGTYVVEAVYAGNYKYLAETKTQTISVR